VLVRSFVATASGKKVYRLADVTPGPHRIELYKDTEAKSSLQPAHATVHKFILNTGCT
jgi:hypothetical protein